MEHQKIYLKYHSKFLDKIIIKKRYEAINIVNELILKNNINSVLDIGTTNDTENESSNIIIRNIKGVQSLNSISDQRITSSYFKKRLKKSITATFTKNELNSFSSDLVISNATIEHVGSFNNQKKMMKNMIQLSKKMIVIITPNRFHPIEFHTKIPFLHWLPKKIHRKILKLINLSQYEKEDYLNLLSINDFQKLAKNENIEYNFKYINLFFFKSNIIFIGKKI